MTSQPRAGTHWLGSLLKDITGYTGFSQDITEKISWTEQLVKEKVEEVIDGSVYTFHAVDPKIIIKYINPATDFVFSITRDLKDILVSKYLIFKYAGAPIIDVWNVGKGDLSDRDFINEYVRDNPPEIWGLIHEVETWKMYNDGYTNPNYMLLTYEDLTNTPLNELKKIITFLSITKTDPELNKTITDNSFETVTGRPNGVGRPDMFIRKGIVGDHLNYMDQDVIDLVGDAIK